MNIFKIKGVVQHYDWGGQEFIPSLLGLGGIDKPCAEYWMGAHEKAPSKIMPDGVELSQYIRSNPEKLGTS